MLVTPLFAAIFALMCVFLALAVIKVRFGHKVLYGDGDVRDLRVAMRTHANFIENVPLALLLMWMIETVLFDSRFAMILGSVLLVGRVLHIIGMKNPKKFMICRQIGMIATLLVLVAAAVKILWQYVPYSG